MASLLTVPLTGFSNPMYLDAADPTNSKGWPIGNLDAYVLAFEGTGVGTVVHEQTVDPDGVVGWFPVLGTQTDSLSTQTGSGATNGKAYIFPCVGVRGRCRVTALATANLQARYQSFTSMYFPGMGTPVLGAGSNLIGSVNDIPGSGSAIGLVPVKAAAAAASLIVKASAGNLYGFNVKGLAGGAAQTLLLLDSATLPADGAVVPVEAFDMPAAGTLKYNFTVPIRFSAGCVMCLSSATTPYTKTIQVTAGNFCFMSAEIS